MVITEVAFAELNESAIEKAGSDVSLVKMVQLCCSQLLKRAGKHAFGYNTTLV